MTMDRRSFLAASFVALALGAPLRAGAETAHGLRDAAEIGQAVLRAGAVEADERALRRELGFGTAEPLALDRSFRDAIRRDFAAGETVHVEGWVLSRTEARLCALAALSLPVA
jgi:hypothetical protein